MCFGSRKSDKGEARSRELDRVIRQDERRMAREVKLLLLGRFFVQWQSSWVQRRRRDIAEVNLLTFGFSTI